MPHDLGRPTGDEVIVHVDLDAFYASVEQRDNPELRGRPVVVGGTGVRGVVAASSYEARRFGIFSAMPTARARRLCPDAVFLRPDFAKYQRESRAVMSILKSFTPLIEQLSLDEAFLDVSGARRLFGAPVDMADSMRRRIAGERGLAASAGVAANKLLAKLSSRAAKPNGTFCVPTGSETEYLSALEVRDLWGVGPSTLKKLESVGISSIPDLLRVSVSTLDNAVGTRHCAHLRDLARGVDNSPVVTERVAKSIGHEETFEHDLAGDAIKREILDLSNRVGKRLRDADMTARTITLKIREPDFKTKTRSITLDDAINSGPDVYQAACTLFARTGLEKSPLRLVGVSASKLASGAVADRLLSPAGVRDWNSVMAASDALARRFGSDVVKPARLIDRPARPQNMDEVRKFAP